MNASFPTPGSIEEITKCVRLPLTDGAALELLYRHGGQSGRVCDDNSGLYFFMLPEGWQMLQAHHKRRDAWDRGESILRPEAILEGGSTVAMIVDELGRQRIRVHYTYNGAHPSFGHLVLAFRYGVKYVYQDGTLVAHVMDGTESIFSTDPVEFHGSSWQDDIPLHREANRIICDWAAENIGEGWNGITCDTYDEV